MTNLVEIQIRASDLTGPGVTSALARIETLRKAVNSLGSLNVADNTGPAISAALGRVEVLRKAVNSVGSLNVTDRTGPAISAAIARVEALKKTVNSVGGVNLSGVTGVAATNTAIKSLGDTEVATAAKTRLLTDAFTTGDGVWHRGTASVGLYNSAMSAARGHLQLFGGALTSVGIPAVIGAASGMHMLFEAVLETTATLIPAAIAFTAFGAAAVPAVMDIYNQMQHLHTVSTAFGQSIYPITGGFTKMAEAVRPEVYTLFGEGLVMASSKGGVFASIATSAGKALEDLGARFVVATTSGNGFGGFLKSATGDMAGWGNLIGNLGGIIGNFLKVMPGFAEILLNVAQSLTHIAEVATAVAEPILRIGLAAHGTIFYVGLLGTAFAKLATSGLAAIASGALNAAVGLTRLGALGNAASGGMLKFAAAAEKAGTLPWGWISLAAAGLAFLAFQLVTSKDAAQKFNDSIQQLVQNTSLATLPATIMAGMASTQAKLAVSTRDLNTALKTNTQVFAGRAGVINSNGAAVMQAARAQQQYSDGLSVLRGEATLVNSRMAALSKEYGGNAAALAVLNGAGITAAQITDKNKEHWAVAQVEIAAYNNALKAMAVGTGLAGAANNALGNSFMTTVIPAMQKVIQAEDNLLTVVTSGESAFTGFQQSIQGTTAKFKSPSGLADAAKFAKGNLSGLNEQSLYFANTLYNISIPALQKTIGSLQQQGASVKQVTTAVATGAGEILKYTGNNEAARATIVALINNALGPGTVSLQNVNKWVKQNSTTMAGFSSIIAQATIKAGSLAGVLQNDLNAQFAKDILQATGASKALSTYTTDLINLGTNSSKTQSARAQLIKDLENGGLSAKQAAAYVDGLTKSLGKVPKNTQANVNMNGKGQYSISEINANTGKQKEAAEGWYVTGGTPGRDSVPVMAMPGEVIVPTRMVKAGAVDHLRGQIPGFANGGVVGGNLTPSYIGGMYSSFHDKMTASMVAAMRAGLSAAEAAAAKAAAAAANSGGNVGSASGGVTRWKNNILKALSMLGQSSGNLGAVEHRMEFESGGNPYAVNKSDSNWARGTPSVGLMQVIGPTYRSNSYPAWRTLAPMAYGTSESPTANIYAGLHHAIHDYRGRSLSSVMMQPGGYSSGGATSGGLISVGEHGRELIKVPGGSTVIPNGQANSMLTSGSGGGPVLVQLEITGGQSATEQFLLKLIREQVRVKGGGDVQKAFGRN